MHDGGIPDAYGRVCMHSFISFLSICANFSAPFAHVQCCGICITIMVVARAVVIHIHIFEEYLINDACENSGACNLAHYVHLAILFLGLVSNQSREDSRWSRARPMAQKLAILRHRLKNNISQSLSQHMTKSHHPSLHSCQNDLGEQIDFRESNGTCHIAQIDLQFYILWDTTCRSYYS